MLSYMQRANSMVLLSTSQLSGLHPLEESAAVERKVPFQALMKRVENFAPRLIHLPLSRMHPRLCLIFLQHRQTCYPSLEICKEKSVIIYLCTCLKILGSLRHSNAYIKEDDKPPA